MKLHIEKQDGDASTLGQVSPGVFPRTPQRHIVKFPHDGERTFPKFRINVDRIVHHPADGTERDTGPGRDITNGKCFLHCLDTLFSL